MKRIAIHWFRRDLRIADNPSLRQASAEGKSVLPLYVVGDWKGGHHWTGPNRQKFLCDCLASLAADLKKAGANLCIRTGNALDVLPRIAEETGAAEVHCNGSPDPFGKALEKSLADILGKTGVVFTVHHDVSLHGPEEVLTGSGGPYRVFTPYANNWSQREKPMPDSEKLRPNALAGIRSEKIPGLAHWGLAAGDSAIVEAGEAAAMKRLDAAIGQIIGNYGNLRDFPAAGGTSRLSQDLRFGLLSIRTVYQRAVKAMTSAKAAKADNIATFLKELAWREFYFSILHHFPEVLEVEFQEKWRGLPWREPDESFELWKAGKTGFPIVDAGMRQLRATGFMHNRVRMITAMFLTKDLHIDWRHGESWFLQQLVDGEIASNNGGWQWSAGTGADAAPYFRIQNPWTQSARYDANGDYIRRWVPELENTPAKQLHRPPADGKPIAPDYPLPCVDHSRERQRTLALFKNHNERRR